MAVGYFFMYPQPCTAKKNIPAVRPQTPKGASPKRIRSHVRLLRCACNYCVMETKRRLFDQQVFQGLFHFAVLKGKACFL